MKRDSMGRRYVSFRTIDDLGTKELSTLLRQATEACDEHGGCAHWERRQVESEFKRIGLHQ